MLSRFEIEVAVSRILDALPDLRLADDTPPPDVGLFLRGPATLPVRFSPTVLYQRLRKATDPAAAPLHGAPMTALFIPTPLKNV